ncbi:MAG: dienelactone hydrolase family protein [Rhodospirillaceae bacterium]|nr:dienelactone hydrolase family protein [Rhodospirillaceae bacterium]
MPQGKSVRLTATDGHSFEAFHAMPPRTPRGGLVLIQEIFGVNEHIRTVAKFYASKGYAVLAPALFDRVEPGVELGYDEAGVTRGRALRTSIGWDSPIHDIAACEAELVPYGRVATLGYCWGGSLSYVAAARTRVSAAVCYYGAQIIDFRFETPHCPVLMHFGEKDALITKDDVAAIRSARPDAEIHTYPAGHGFNCTERVDYHQDSAALAAERTLAFLSASIG